MANITASVGNGGMNKPAEVLLVQKLLNGHFSRLRNGTSLQENGSASPELYKFIRIFQFSMGIRSPDSLISPGGQTLKTLLISPQTYRLEGKILQGQNEDSPENRNKRSLIEKIATSYNNSNLWAYTAQKGDFPINSNKCNKFVYDVLQEAKIDAYVVVQGKRRAPLAAEWADKNTEIRNWRVLSRNEARQPGDVAAYSLPGGGASFSGHTGFIVRIGGALTNISAHKDSVYPEANQFESNSMTSYRRYIGE